jgi:hypothetical protein
MKTRSLKAVVTALLSATILIASNSVFAGGDRTRLECDADGINDTSMSARYENRNNGAREKFDATFEANRARSGFEAGDTVDVFISGVATSICTITLANVGPNAVGDCEFDTNIEPGDDDGVAFPGNFPAAVTAGDVVTVGAIPCPLDD